MVPPFQNQHRSDTLDNTVSPFPEFSVRPDLRPELLHKLTSRLQTSLDIEQLLTIFFGHIQEAVLVDGLRFDNNEHQLTTLLGRQGAHSASYQLQTQTEHLGNLLFYRSTRFREHEMANIEGLLSTLVYPLRNALHYHIAVMASHKDLLTGTSNRVALSKTLAYDLACDSHTQKPLALLMLDLDFFKQVNDQYGHLVGDAVLKVVAQSIKGCLREQDRCYRYGGEEFLISLHDADQQSAFAMAERIRQNIAELEFNSDNDELFRISCSIGYSMHQAQDNLDRIVKRVDDALYKAKALGRNSIVLG